MLSLLPSTIVGAGPVGCLLAIILRRQGVDVTLYEARPDLRETSLDGGRSINLVLTRRGLRALAEVGLRDEILKITVPVLGRMMHDGPGNLTYQPYGHSPDECNYSVSRTVLNQRLLDAAEQAGASIHFAQPLRDVDFARNTLTFDDQEIPFDMLFAADGAPSVVRRAMESANRTTSSVEMMAWGYKEVSFPTNPDGSPPMADHALHIWPRGHHFLMGLANLDGSFTGTLYLPMEGSPSFASLTTPDTIRSYFAQHYPDALDLLGDFVSEIQDHPTGTLGTVRADRWAVEDHTLLIGDAAHGIVPFFGQGLNSGFEDCRLLSDALTQGEDLHTTLHSFATHRRPDTDAIADMALENFVEMSEKVADPRFLLRKKVESVLQDSFPHYRPRYALVMYSHLPYRSAQRIGATQGQILDELIADIDTLEHLDLAQARTLLQTHLDPLHDALGLPLATSLP